MTQKSFALNGHGSTYARASSAQKKDSTFYCETVNGYETTFDLKLFMLN
jgi:hypothetical protein